MPFLFDRSLSNWIPVVLTFFLCFFLGFFILGLSYIRGRQRPGVEKRSVYECGIDAAPADGAFHVPFYRIALIFLLFDVEVAFVMPWALCIRDLGFFSFCTVFIFLTFLFAGFVLEVKAGTLDWS